MCSLPDTKSYRLCVNLKFSVWRLGPGLLLPPATGVAVYLSKQRPSPGELTETVRELYYYKNQCLRQLVLLTTTFFRFSPTNTFSFASLINTSYSLPTAIQVFIIIFKGQNCRGKYADGQTAKLEPKKSLHHRSNQRQYTWKKKRMEQLY